MNKTKPLTVDEMLLCRDVLNTILGDSDLARGFRQCVNTNNRQLGKVAHKLDMLAKVEMNGGTPPATVGGAKA